MPDFAYTTVPAKIPQLLAKIRDVGVPQKATVNWLKTVGFTSSNDSSLIPVLRQINFVDSSNVPTLRWHSYRGSKHAEVLAESIKKGYSNLFDIYADANSRTQGEVVSVFTNASTAGRQAIEQTYKTFKALCGLANFSAPEAPVEEVPSAEPGKAPEQKAGGVGGRQHAANAPSMHIDIQVHIAPETTAEQIDQIFKSMARHLYGTSDTQ